MHYTPVLEMAATDSTLCSVWFLALVHYNLVAGSLARAAVSDVLTPTADHRPLIPGPSAVQGGQWALYFSCRSASGQLGLVVISHLLRYTVAVDRCVASGV